MNRDPLSRRDFIARAGTAAAAFAAATAHAQEIPAGEKTPPSERVGIGLMGLHNQGRLNGLGFLKTGAADIVAVCDVDDAELDRVGAELEKHPNQPRPPKRVKDFRRLLDDPDIDAIVIVTPDHWHAVATVMACRAGKDVYVEKPLSWCIAEGRAMVKAAREHGRVVQVGSQQRSGSHFIAAMDLVRSGRLGEVPFARAWITHRRPDLGVPPDEPVPEGVDYDLWLGPAPERPFNRNRFHYNWRWFRDYGTGEMGNWGAHWLDVVRWGLDLDLPSAATASGGKFFFRDSRETPDTQMVIYDFPGRTVLWELWEWSQRRYEGHSCGAAFYGSEGTLIVSRSGYWLYGTDGKTLEAESGGSPLEDPHMRNFLECVKTRGPLHADVEVGHKTAIMCHLGNISIRVGRKLTFDPVTEKFIGDDEANTYLEREYREPWTLEG